MTTQVAPDVKDDPVAYDTVHCDQFEIDHEGKPIADDQTDTGSDAGPKAHEPAKQHKLTRILVRYGGREAGGM